ncbi:unnamed protein product [Rhizoctonia solani]|uniref:Uncharacterized protein n=1 Tax=Rhizoctonia solani TaxID=456999 RepID=A0A8H3DCG1_9AGAM|nr:unnamed protein product [Rhizoctonia solani]
MVPALDQRGAPTGGNTERNRSPPAFLDLANSAARQGANLPDVNSRIEQKRMEHERQRLQQRKMFEEQMRMLEHQQALEEQKLMGSPALGGAPMNPALSLIGSGALQHHPAIQWAIPSKIVTSLLPSRLTR